MYLQKCTNFTGNGHNMAEKKECKAKHFSTYWQAFYKAVRASVRNTCKYNIRKNNKNDKFY